MDWDSKFQLLVRFCQREGYVGVPARHVEEGFALGAWVRRQIERADSMAPARKKKLESLPGWVWSGREMQWLRTYETLKRHLLEQGSLHVTKYLILDGIGVGEWVKRQRALYRKGNLSESRVAMLEYLPGWNWTPRGRKGMTIDATIPSEDCRKYRAVPDDLEKTSFLIGRESLEAIRKARAAAGHRTLPAKTGRR